MTLRLSLAGATGRMGQAVQALVADDPLWQLHAAWGRSGPVDLNADVVIDFSTPDSVAANAPAMRTAWVIGVTGLDGEQHAAVLRAAQRVPVVLSGNFSLGVNLLLALVEQAADILPDAAVTITDIHHIHKRDAPSGTALMLQAAARHRQLGRDIPIDSQRVGEVIGDHTVTFTTPLERVVLQHVAHDRSLFARGALTAARWAAHQPAGLYGMRDVLGLKARF